MPVPSLPHLVSFPAIGIGFGVLGFHLYWCPSPFPLPSILGVFHSLLSPIGFQSCFLLYGRHIPTPSVDPSLTHFPGEFPGLGRALVPDVVVPWRSSGAPGAENSNQISALAGIEHRAMAAT